MLSRNILRGNAFVLGSLLLNRTNEKKKKVDDVEWIRQKVLDTSGKTTSQPAAMKWVSWTEASPSTLITFACVTLGRHFNSVNKSLAISH